MKILSYILIALVATIPGLWIDKYTFTNPIWWTVLLTSLIGNLVGYLEGIKKKDKEDKSND